MARGGAEATGLVGMGVDGSGRAGVLGRGYGVEALGVEAVRGRDPERWALGHLDPDALGRRVR